MAKDDWELWIDDTNTVSPEEINRLEKELPPIPAERKRIAEARMEEIYRKFFEENVDDKARRLFGASQRSARQ